MTDFLRSLKSSLLIPLVLFLFALAVRIPFASDMLYHHDSVNFALALEHYDISGHQPHPPGYFLYVMLGKLVHLFIADANSALVSMSIAFNGLTVLFIYLLAEAMYDRRTAIIASLLAVVSPNLWFHAEVALTYGAEAFFSTLTGFLCWRLYQGRHCAIWMSVLALGVAGGFRQNTMIFLFPLWLIAAWKGPGRTRIIPALALLVIVCAAWFVPMASMTGGLDVYMGAFKELWEFSTGHNSVFEKGWQHFLIFSRAILSFSIYNLGAGIVIIGTAFYAAARNGELSSICHGTRWFYAAWILPSYTFYQLIFIHPANPGYALIFLPPLLLLCARGTLRLGERMTAISGKKCTAILTLATLVANMSMFLFSDTEISLPTIRRHDRDLTLIMKEMGSFDPDNTAIILQPYLFHGFRLVMYYLPEYTMYMKNDRSVAAGRKQIFWGTGRRTFISDKILLPANIGRIATFDFEDKGGANSHKVDGLKEIWFSSGPASEMMRDMPN